MSSTFSWGPWAPIAVLLAGGLGTGIALRTLLPGLRPAPDGSEHAETKMWVNSFSLFMGISLATGVALFPEWWNLASGHPRAIALTIILVIMLAALGVMAPRLARSRTGGRDSQREESQAVLENHERRLNPLIFVAILALFPAISGIVLVGLEAADLSGGDTGDSLRIALDEIVQLRGSLLLFLGAAALVIVAGVIATSLLRRATLAMRPGSEDAMPASGPLLYGGFFSLLLGTLFIPAYLGLQEAGEDLVVLALNSVKTPPDHSYFVAREDLRGALELDVSWIGVFAGAFAVLSPAAAALITSLLSPKETAAAPEGSRPEAE